MCFRCFCPQPCYTELPQLFTATLGECLVRTRCTDAFNRKKCTLSHQHWRFRSGHDDCQSAPPEMDNSLDRSIQSTCQSVEETCTVVPRFVVPAWFLSGPVRLEKPRPKESKLRVVSHFEHLINTSPPPED